MKMFLYGIVLIVLDLIKPSLETAYLSSLKIIYVYVAIFKPNLESLFNRCTIMIDFNPMS